MTTPDSGDFFDRNNTYRPDVEDFLKRIANGTLGEVSHDDGDSPSGDLSLVLIGDHQEDGTDTQYTAPPQSHETPRADFGANLAQLVGLEGPAFREGYASLIGSYINRSEGEEHSERLHISISEQEQLGALIAQKFPDSKASNPSPNRPIAEYDPALMAHFTRLYGRDFLQMSRQEYYDFCLDLANGRVAVVLGGGAQAMAFLSEQFRGADQFEMAKQVANYWVPFLQGKQRVSSSQTKNPENEVYVGEVHFAAEIFKKLNQVAATDSTVRDYLFNLTTGVLEEDIRTGNAHLLSAHLVTALRYTLNNAAVWDVEQGCQGVVNFDNLFAFVGKVGQLDKIATQLSALNNTANQVTLLELRVLIDHAKFLDNQPPH